jgi:hypothetical protein
MQFSELKLFALACMLCATSACSPSTPNAVSSEGVAPSAVSSPDEDSPTKTAVALDCSKVFAPSDVAGILTGPIQIDRGAYPIGCHFAGTGASVSVNIDPTFEMPWSTDAAGSDFVDLPGVGDQARRRASNDYECVSRKGNSYCAAGFSMQSNPTSLGGEELAKRLGALCNKLFAVNS